MLNIVQDSALLEAIGCQLETVRFISLNAFIFVKDALFVHSRLSQKIIVHVYLSCGRLINIVFTPL